MNGNQAAALVAAGRFLQSRRWPGGGMKITCAQGEAYPQAVARVIATLDDGDRDRLRELVAWVLDYDRHDRSRRQPEQARRAPPEDPAFDLPRRQAERASGPPKGLTVFSIPPIPKGLADKGC